MWDDLKLLVYSFACFFLFAYCALVIEEKFPRKIEEKPYDPFKYTYRGT